MTARRSAIVLVGGEARRAQGKEKYFFLYHGRTFISRLVESLGEVVDEIILVARDPAQCSRFDGMDKVRCISDIRPGIGPVGGLHAGALAATGEFVFVSACDMPCISPSVVRYLFERASDRDAAIPSWNLEMLEPLHAVYRRTTLLTYLDYHDSRSLRNMVRSLTGCYIPVDELRAFDPELRTFTNINKIEELEKINAEASPEGKNIH